MAATMKARPTVYKGIKMRSRMEAGFAHQGPWPEGYWKAGS